MFKSFIYFNKNERWGLTIWSLTILLLCYGLTDFSLFEGYHQDKSVERYVEILDSLSRADKLEKRRQFAFQAFNPNEVNAAELEAMGINEQLSSTWVRFRKSIGGFRSMEDIEKIYGLDSNLLDTLKPFIQFAKDIREVQSKVDKQHAHSAGNSLSSPKSKSNAKPIEESKYSGQLDINKCSHKQLKQVGFSDRIAWRIINYRKKVSPFYKYEELYQIYDIDSQLVKRLRPKLSIDKSQLPLVDINAADAATLKSLPGIGDVYSKRILEFRGKIGSFTQIDQLLDIYGIDKELLAKINDRIHLTPGKIKQLVINQASLEELKAHPYISWDLADRILNYRKHHYPIKDIKNLIGVDLELIHKLEPYITYELNVVRKNE